MLLYLSWEPKSCGQPVAQQTNQVHRCDLPVLTHQTPGHDMQRQNCYPRPLAPFFPRRQHSCLPVALRSGRPGDRGPVLWCAGMVSCSSSTALSDTGHLPLRLPQIRAAVLEVVRHSAVGNPGGGRLCVAVDLLGLFHTAGSGSGAHRLERRQPRLLGRFGPSLRSRQRSSSFNRRLQMCCWRCLQVAFMLRTGGLLYFRV